MRRLLVLAFSVVILVLVANVTSAYAFTLLRDVWPTASTTYRMEPSFTNQGAAWVNRANEAALHWTNLTDFDFVFDSNSPNRLRTGTLSCTNPTTLATMAPVEDSLGIYRNSFVITVNTGCPNIQWYTGTGTPPSGFHDLRTVLRHEFGHAAGLDHVQGANTQLMYPFIDPVAIKQIGADDQNGIDFLYDPSSSVRLQSAATYYVGGATYDNNYPAVGYKGRNWTGGSPFSHALFQTASWSNQTGASSWFAFLGARVTWVFAKAANRGWQDVYIDGTLVESINTDDNDDNLWQVHRTWDMDTPGYHVIEIRGLGNGTDYTDLDGYVVDILRAQGAHDDTSGYVRYIGNWTHSSGWPNADNGTVSWSNTADDAVVFTFVGDGITYSFTKGPNRGKVKVTIDGEYKETIDLYSAAPQWSVDRRWPLSLGTHTIHLAVTGEKHSSSSGIYVDVDQLAVD